MRNLLCGAERSSNLNRGKIRLRCTNAENRENQVVQQHAGMWFISATHIWNANALCKIFIFILTSKLCFISNTVIQKISICKYFNLCFAFIIYKFKISLFIKAPILNFPKKDTYNTSQTVSVCLSNTLLVFSYKAREPQLLFLMILLSFANVLHVNK